MVRRLLVTLSILLCLPIAALAQTSTAALSGVVIDESKSVMPGVTVTATDLASGRQYTAVTDAQGNYRILNVAPSKYRVRAELSGFATLEIREIELLVGQTANIPMTMALAAMQESVTVSGESPLVDTRSSQVVGNVDRRQMEQLPL